MLSQRYVGQSEAVQTCRKDSLSTHGIIRGPFCELEQGIGDSTINILDLILKLGFETHCIVWNGTPKDKGKNIT